MATIPITVLIVLARKRFIQDINLTGTKGWATPAQPRPDGERERVNYVSAFLRCCPRLAAPGQRLHIPAGSGGRGESARETVTLSDRVEETGAAASAASIQADVRTVAVAVRAAALRPATACSDGFMSSGRQAAAVQLN